MIASVLASVSLACMRKDLPGRTPANQAVVLRIAESRGMQPDPELRQRVLRRSNDL